MCLHNLFLKLEYSFFTVLCQFPPSKKLNQLYVCVYIPPHPDLPPNSTHLSHHRAPSSLIQTFYILCYSFRLLSLFCIDWASILISYFYLLSFLNRISKDIYLCIGTILFSNLFLYLLINFYIYFLSFLCFPHLFRYFICIVNLFLFSTLFNDHTKHL